MIEYGGWTGRQARSSKPASTDVVLTYRLSDSMLMHVSFGIYMQPIRREGERLVKGRHTCGVAKTEAVCWEIIELCEALWTFMYIAACRADEQTAQPNVPSVRTFSGAKAALQRKVRRAPFCRSADDPGVSC
jgi:hypothetical protein